MDSIDRAYFRGNDLRPVRGIITRNLSQSMVEITDLTDASVHRRHIDQIHFRDEQTVSVSEPHEKEDNPSNSEPPESEATVPQCHDVEQADAVQPAESEAKTSATLRRSRRKASQIDEALLREESCGDRVTSTHAPQYGFQVTNQKTKKPTSTVVSIGTNRIGRMQEGKQINHVVVD
ncbi:unnamed protein product [Echinostoma caproni]|uniref:DUF2382 domain-containing protein n=1 Tax=Echinostoma caproni TaxID=27848 RepID=A0A183AUU9_9TREM|nr:unnamed protein product [Echinostoma caproni]